jgi:hypothetical protein
MLHSVIKPEDVGLELSYSWEVTNKKFVKDAVTLSTIFKRGKR